jgi:type I restriction enzyme, S subunit
MTRSLSAGPPGDTSLDAIDQTNAQVSEMKRALFQKHRLGDLVSFVSGGTPSKQVADFWGGNTPWVSAKDLKSMRISSSIETLSDQGRSQAALVPPGTVLVLVRGMSLFNEIPLGIADCHLAINQDVKGLIPTEAVSADFLAYSLLSQERTLLDMVESSGHGTGRLDTDTLKDLSIWLPPRSIQDQIVTLLAFWGTAIHKTDQLIAAKQKLLRAYQRRFLAATKSPCVQLGSLFEQVTRKLDGPSTPIATISAGRGFLLQEERFNRVLAGQNLANYTALRRGEFAYNKGSSKRYEFGCVYQLTNYSEIAIPNVYVSFSPRVHLVPEFYALWFEADLLKPQLRRVVNSGVRNDGLLNINAETFFALKVPQPSLEEQGVMARAFLAIKDEITLLKQQLEALRKQKRGLIREMLMGKPIPRNGSNEGGV